MNRPAVRERKPLRGPARLSIGRAARVAGLLAMGAALLGALAACGSDEPTATPPPLDPGAASEAPTGFQAEWDALIVAARDEGRLVMAGGGGSWEMRKFYKHFGEKFGIKPILSGGSGQEQANRILAEQGAGRFDVDIVHAGPTTIKKRLGPRALEFFPPWLFHPEVIDESLWYEGKHKYSDEEAKTGFVYSGRPTSGRNDDGAGMGLWYNTNLVTQEEIDALETPWDLIQDKWKGEFVSHDPTQGSGGGGELLDAYRDSGMGTEWLEAYWLGMEPFITADLGIIQSTLVNGRFHWAYTHGAGEPLRDLQRLGAPISTTFPRKLLSFNEMSGGGTAGGFAIAKNPPHPNATKLYVNWFLSREGQILMHSVLRDEDRPDRGARASLREDIEPGLTDPTRRRVPGVIYTWEPDLDPELGNLRFEAMEWLADLLGRERLRARN